MIRMDLQGINYVQRLYCDHCEKPIDDISEAIASWIMIHEEGELITPFFSHKDFASKGKMCSARIEKDLKSKKGKDELVGWVEAADVLGHVVHNCKANLSDNFVMASKELEEGEERWII